MMFIGGSIRDVQVTAYVKPQFLQWYFVYVLIMCSWTEVTKILSNSHRFIFSYKSRIRIQGIPNHCIYLRRKYRNPYISLPCCWKKMEFEQSGKSFGNPILHYVGHKAPQLGSIYSHLNPIQFQLKVII
jgi:hypothetical protein